MREDLRRLHRIDWHPRMLVKSEHLVHTDDRAAALISIMSRIDRGGAGIAVLGEGQDGTPLVTVTRVLRDAGTIEADVRLNRAFAAICPDGSVIVFDEPQETDYRVVVPAVQQAVLTVTAQDNQENVDVPDEAQSNDDRLYVDAKPAFSFASPLDFDDPIPDSKAACVAIGSYRLVDDALELEPDYVPPVVRLDLADAFNPGLLGRLSAELQSVRENLEIVIAPVARVPSQEMGQKLTVRVNDLTVLHALMVSKVGVMREFDTMSPQELMRELALPLAVWARTFGLRFKRPIEELIDAAVAVENISFGTMRFNTGELLVRTMKLAKAVKVQLASFG